MNAASTAGEGVACGQKGNSLHHNTIVTGGEANF
jgi:hypothetical protein